MSNWAYRLRVVSKEHCITKVDCTFFEWILFWRRAWKLNACGSLHDTCISNIHELISISSKIFNVDCNLLYMNDVPYLGTTDTVIWNVVNVGHGF